jgi:glycine/D-amino acid oxidase-like deaminating enzyme
VNATETVDYIIVGQGLAGSSVALQLIKREKKILVIDDSSSNHSSRIAAGLFNPVTGQNLVKTWMADTIFPYLHRYYREVELLTQKRFFQPMKLYRPFGSASEQNDWMGRTQDPLYAPYVDSINTSSRFPGEIKDNSGGMMLKQCGVLNTASYVDAIRDHIRSSNHFLDQPFNYDSVTINRDHVEYAGFRARKIIFCEGYRNAINPWFKRVPIRPLKGETITIKTAWPEHVILNRGVYMVPGIGPDEWRVGSTYNYNVTEPGTTQKGCEELTEKLNQLISFSFTIIAQDWGIRPTTIDRRPILGMHKDFERLLIFNGLGTKGVSLAPYFSEVFVRWVLGEGPLHKEVDVTRYN